MRMCVCYHDDRALEIPDPLLFPHRSRPRCPSCSAPALIRAPRPFKSRRAFKIIIISSFTMAHEGRDHREARADQCSTRAAYDTAQHNSAL